MNVKKIVGIISKIIFVLMAIMLILFYLSHYVIADPVGLRIQKVTVDEQYIIISGFNYGGMYNYRGYTTKYSDGVLCIKFSGGFDMPWLLKCNSPDFCPVLNKYEGISQIYLSSGQDDKRRLVWTETDGEIIENNSY